MPHLLASDHGETSRSRSRQRARTEVTEHRSMWDRLSLQKIGSWLKRDEEEPPPSPKKTASEPSKDLTRPHSSAGLLGRRSSRKVVPGLPRPLTFKRMNSEKRAKLLEVPLEADHRRPASLDRNDPVPPKRNLSPPPMSIPSMSAPDVLSPHESSSQAADKQEEDRQQQQQQVDNQQVDNQQVDNQQVDSQQVDSQQVDSQQVDSHHVDNHHVDSQQQLDSSNHHPHTQHHPEPTIGGKQDSNIPAGSRQVDYGLEELHRPVHADEPPAIDLIDALSQHSSHHSQSDLDDIRLQEEMEAKWILNLSMHFRDMSDREKFFVTYAEEPTKWRRVTVSCDYRRLEPESLEADLKSLHYQRDKSSRIYEAIRDSLADIQFYDTVTNLKLETASGRLHVHVTEDVNEIIPYPSCSAIAHLDCQRFKESAVSFDSHISGFVYKVAVQNRTYIKKEIPGPDSVEEFLYEINALCSLGEAKSVIRFEGVIVDEHDELIKGLLISYAEQGALVDMIYDFKPTGQLHWERRERWARQIVQGLSEIHEAGFVQGDFTLSNIVIDHNDDAKIIDINRRGCPVGWEPPELAKLIESGQRISIYIGVKSDLYQLGMVLWALAEQQDEPERQDRPLTKLLDRPNSEVPHYFRDIVRACLSEFPRDRPSAANLFKRFPDLVAELGLRTRPAARESVSSHRSDKEYIDPATAVDLEDISQHRRNSRQQSSFENITVPQTDYPPSSGSYIIPGEQPGRGRSCDSNSRNRSDCSPYPGHRSVMSLDDSEIENDLVSYPASRETRWEQVYIDGDTKLVQRGCADIDVHDFATQEPKDICITSPPGDTESSFLGSKPADDTPLSLSIIAGLQPVDPQHRGVGSKASFSDRVHQLAQSQRPEHGDTHHSRQSVPDPTLLADLEHDIAMDSSVTSTNPPSRVGTGFSIFDLPERATRVGTGFSIAQGHHRPVHQDSGFAEPERRSYESERTRLSLDESIRDLKMARISGTSWEGLLRGKELEVQPSIPVFNTIPASPKPVEKSRSTAPPRVPVFGAKNVLCVDDVPKAVEEKTSNTTIRPPSILIPEYNHGLPKPFAGSSSCNISPPSATSDAPMFSAKEHQHPYYDDDPFDDESQATDDLSDYLSHSISYSHQPDFLPYYQDPKAPRGAPH
ncbi:hypothetical protein ACN47E_002804 [Coniothyrium glycines]